MLVVAEDGSRVLKIATTEVSTIVVLQACTSHSVSIVLYLVLTWRAWFAGDGCRALWPRRLGRQATRRRPSRSSSQASASVSSVSTAPCAMVHSITYPQLAPEYGRFASPSLWYLRVPLCRDTFSAVLQRRMRRRVVVSWPTCWWTEWPSTTARTRTGRSPSRPSCTACRSTTTATRYTFLVRAGRRRGRACPQWRREKACMLKFDGSP